MCVIVNPKELIKDFNVVVVKYFTTQVGHILTKAMCFIFVMVVKTNICLEKWENGDYVIHLLRTNGTNIKNG